jgi:hypothetical protein
MGSSIFQRPTSPLWRGRRCDGGVCAGVFRDQVGVLAEPVAGTFDLDHNGMVQEPIQKRGRDKGITEDLAPGNRPWRNWRGMAGRVNTAS